MIDNYGKQKKFTLYAFSVASFLLTNTSAYLGYLLNKYTFSYFNYFVMAFALTMTIIAFARNGYLSRVDGGAVYFFGYSILYLIEYQIINITGSGVVFGISTYTIVLLQVITALLIWRYIMNFSDRNLCNAIIVIYAIILVIDVIHSFSVLSVNSEALRISAWTTGKSYLESMNIYGVCNVNHIYSYLCAIPFIICLVSNIKLKMIKVIMIGLLALDIALILRSGYASSILILLVYFVYKFINPKSKWMAIIASLLAALIFFIVAKEFNLFAVIARNLSNESAKERFLLIDSFLSGNAMSGDLLSRFEAYSQGLIGFLKSPLIGNVIFGNRIISGHSTLIDLLSDWGILGFGLYVAFIVYTLKRVRQNLSPNSYQVFKEAYALFVVGLIINPLGYYVQIYASVLVFGIAALKKVDFDNAVIEEGGQGV